MQRKKKKYHSSVRPVVVCARCKKKVYLENAIGYGSEYYGEECYNILTKEEKAKIQAMIEENKKKKEMPKARPSINFSELVTTTAIAKELGTTAVKLNKFLVEHGVIEKPLAFYELCTEYKHLENDGYVYIVASELGITIKWTAKGREWLIDFYNKATTQ